MRMLSRGFKMNINHPKIEIFVSNYKDKTINIGCHQMLDSFIVSKR